MDLEDFEAFVRANQLTLEPAKRIIWGLLISLVLALALLGFIFLQFLRGAFTTSVAQSTESVTDSVITNVVGE